MNNQNLRGQVSSQEALVRKMLETAKPHACHSCNCKAFTQAISIMEISAIDPNNPTGQSQSIQYPVLSCIKCHEIYDPAGRIK